jgi:hypothetical protein
MHCGQKAVNCVCQVWDGLVGEIRCVHTATSTSVTSLCQIAKRLAFFFIRFCLFIYHSQNRHTIVFRLS